MFLRLQNKISHGVKEIENFHVPVFRIACVRSILACAILMDIVFTQSEFLVDPHQSSISIFKLIAQPYARMLSILILLAVIAGFFPRITSFLHWWVVFSFKGAIYAGNGGTNVQANLSLLLIPVCFALPYFNHWRIQKEEKENFEQKTLCYVGLIFCHLQVMNIYLYAAIAKLAKPLWVNGKAMLYWSNNPFVGLPDWAYTILQPIYATSIGGLLSCWAVILFEVALALAFCFSRKWKTRMLYAGICFHVLIACMIGIVSFAMVMCAALILYLGYDKRRISSNKIQHKVSQKNLVIG